MQACTGIEDIAEALNVLEQADWDLMVSGLFFHVFVNNLLSFLKTDHISDF